MSTTSNFIRRKARYEKLSAFAQRVAPVIANCDYDTFCRSMGWDGVSTRPIGKANYRAALEYLRAPRRSTR